jgi:hypothetical protein
MLGEEVFLRVVMGGFFFLCWVCSNVIIAPVDSGAVQLTLLVFLEVTVIVVTALLFGDKNVVRDINEFNTYALMAHLLYLPFFFAGVLAVYHNTAINVLLCLAAVRLLYFGPCTADGDFKGLPIFGLLGHVRVWWQAQPALQTHTLNQYLPEILFFGAAIPLWAIMVRVNDLSVTVTIAVLMSFIFFIAKQLQARMLALQAANAAAIKQLHDEQICHARTVAERDGWRARAQALEAELARYTATDTIQRLHTHAAALDALAPETHPDAFDAARTLVQAWQETHPGMRNLQLALAQYMACQFPDDNVFGAQSITRRSAKALRELAELLYVTQAQLALANAPDAEVVDYEYLPTNIDNAPGFDIDTMAVKGFMTYILLVPYKRLTNRTLILTCEVLTTALLRILLSQCGKEYLNDFPELEEMTKKFVAQHIPLHDADDVEDAVA